mgnify:CR=1 FL=1
MGGDVSDVVVVSSTHIISSLTVFSVCFGKMDVTASVDSAGT